MNVKVFRKFFFSRITIVIIILLVGGFFLWRNTLGKTKALESYTVGRNNVSEELILSGEIAAVEHAKLAFQTSGELSWIGVKEGDIVKKGQSIAKIDTVSLNSTYQRARADLRAAEASVEKIHDDVKNHGSDETFTQKEIRTDAEVTKDKAYEAVLMAEKALKDAILRSPFAGTVTYVANPFPKVNVVATQTQVEVINTATVYFKVLADQTEVINLSEGKTAEIILDPIDDKKLKGVISAVSFAPDPNEASTVYEVKVIFSNFDEIKNIYRIGMSGDAVFQLKKVENVISVPPKFVKTDKDGKYVLTNNGKTKNRVEIGLEGEDFIEIKSGLSEGTVVYD
jgi:membrane fusion protein, macrolide-specific efflux system